MPHENLVARYGTKLLVMFAFQTTGNRLKSPVIHWVQLVPPIGVVSLSFLENLNDFANYVRKNHRNRTCPVSEETIS